MDIAGVSLEWDRYVFSDMYPVVWNNLWPSMMILAHVNNLKRIYQELIEGLGHTWYFRVWGSYFAKLINIAIYSMVKYNLIAKLTCFGVTLCNGYKVTLENFV